MADKDTMLFHGDDTAAHLLQLANLVSLYNTVYTMLRARYCLYSPVVNNYIAMQASESLGK